MTSLPAWERGLKQAQGGKVEALPGRSLPAWERGLKPAAFFALANLTASLPAWERGLKHLALGVGIGNAGRSPRGSVD